MFAIWQANDHKGFRNLQCAQPPFCWNELGTSDTEKAGSFTPTCWLDRGECPESPIEYMMFKNGDRGAGGMYQITLRWDRCRHTGWFTLRSTIATRKCKKPPNLAVA